MFDDVGKKNNKKRVGESSTPGQIHHARTAPARPPASVLLFNLSGRFALMVLYCCSVVGEAAVQMHGKYLPAHDYIMDGEENSYCQILLHWADKKGDSLAAGRISLGLVFVPAPDLLAHTTENITKSWYFEASVLGMVVLAMVVMAALSPADPPSPVALGAIRVLEVFLATHMTVELAMELSVNLSLARPWRKDPWFMLALVVLCCTYSGQ